MSWTWRYPRGCSSGSVLTKLSRAPRERWNRTSSGATASKSSRWLAWTGAHAELQREHLGGQLAAFVDLAEQRPEVGDRVPHGVRVIGVGSPAGKRLLEAAPARLLPIGEALPEETIEAPEERIAQRRPTLEVEAPVLFAGLAAEGGERPAQSFAGFHCRGLTEIDGDFGQRQRPALAVGRAPEHHGVAEIGAVLHPVEMDAETGEVTGIGVALLDEREQRRQRLAGSRGESGRQMVDVEDHSKASV